MNYVPNLGETPAEDSRRDAVHIAVIPIVAGEMLCPGDRVCIRDNCAYLLGGKEVGIVDPFLTVDTVKKGEQFWLLMLPLTVTDLRHTWRHWAFKTKIPEVP
jgi:hypothetical protein